MVDVGVVLDGVVEVPDGVDVPEALEDEELAVVGDGETIDGVKLDAAELAALEAAAAGLDVDADEDEPLDGGAGLVLSLGTPPANGSRAIRASTTLAGSVEGACVVVVWLAVVAVAAGGAGGSDVPLAGVPLSSSTGMATTPTRSAATSIQSLRSSRSRRSALISVLRSWSWPQSRQPAADRSRR